MQNLARYFVQLRQCPELLSISPEPIPQATVTAFVELLQETAGLDLITAAVKEHFPRGGRLGMLTCFEWVTSLIQNDKPLEAEFQAVLEVIRDEVWCRREAGIIRTQGEEYLPHVEALIAADFAEIMEVRQLLGEQHVQSVPEELLDLIKYSEGFRIALALYFKAWIFARK